MVTKEQIAIERYFNSMFKKIFFATFGWTN